MPDATRLCHLRRRKKKVNGFIIPPNFFYGRVLEIPVKSPEIIAAPDIAVVEIATEVTIAVATEEAIIVAETTIETVAIPAEIQTEVPVPQPEIKVSALSLASIRAKRELEQTTKAMVKEDVHLPTEAFTETDMLLQWNKFAQRLSDRGHKIMESLLLINYPKLDGTTIIHELPNEGSKIDFESGKHELVGYLRGKLHNHDIDIRIIVNESMDSRKAFTPQDRFNRLNEINPSLELLRKTFDLDI